MPSSADRRGRDLAGWWRRENGGAAEAAEAGFFFPSDIGRVQSVRCSVRPELARTAGPSPCTHVCARVCRAAAGVSYFVSVEKVWDGMSGLCLAEHVCACVGGQCVEGRYIYVCVCLCAHYAHVGVLGKDVCGCWVRGRRLCDIQIETAVFLQCVYVCETLLQSVKKCRNGYRGPSAYKCAGVEIASLHLHHLQL